jgi:hypothetical protein
MPKCRPPISLSRALHVQKRDINNIDIAIIIFTAMMIDDQWKVEAMSRESQIGIPNTLPRPANTSPRGAETPRAHYQY